MMRDRVKWKQLNDTKRFIIIAIIGINIMFIYCCQFIDSIRDLYWIVIGVVVVAFICWFLKPKTL